MWPTACLDIGVQVGFIDQESQLAIFRLLVQLGPDGIAATRIGEQPPMSE